MVSWKAKYKKLKNSRKKSFLGRITGGINQMARSAIPLAMNVVSGVSAIAPLVSRLLWVKESPGTRLQYLGENLVLDYTGYHRGTFDMSKPVAVGAGVVFPQLLKKGLKMVGRL